MADHEATVSRANPLAYLKSIAAGAGAGIWALTAYITGDETLLNVTTNEWLNVILAILSTFGIVYIVPNKGTASK